MATTVPTTPAGPPIGNKLNGSGSVPQGTNRGSFPITMTLTANQVVTIPIAGVKYYVEDLSDGTLTVQPNNGPPLNCKLGQGDDLGPNSPFVNVTLSNPNSFPITFTLVISWWDFIDRRLLLVPESFLTGMPVQVQTTVTRSLGFASLTGNTGAFIDGNVGKSLGYGNQKQIVLQNNDGTKTLQVTDILGAQIYILGPGSSWTLETSDGVNLNNNNSGSINCCGSQTWYTAIAGVQQ